MKSERLIPLLLFQLIAMQANAEPMEPLLGASFWLSIFLMLGLGFVALLVVKRLSLKNRSKGHGLQLITSLQLGTRERLCIVKFDDDYLLLGVTSNSINFLAKTKNLTEAKEDFHTTETTS